MIGRVLVIMRGLRPTVVSILAAVMPICATVIMINRRDSVRYVPALSLTAALCIEHGVNIAAAKLQAGREHGDKKQTNW